MLCILQARMGSKRVPKKMLIKLNGKALISRVYDQLIRSKSIKKIIIASSKAKSNNSLEKYCKFMKINFFRGSENNVASRFYKILKESKFNYFVRICGDSPLIDYRLIDKMAKFSKKGGYDIITNLLPRTYPRGQSVEIIKSRFFLKNYNKIKKKFDKEHVTTYFYKNSKKFKIKSFTSEIKFRNTNYCVDRQDDLIKIEKILKICKNKVPSLEKLDKFSLKVI